MGDLIDEASCGVFSLGDDDVERWRLQVLLEAGYPLELAERLAVRRWDQVDLHQAVELVKRGCPPELAALILL